MIKFDLLKAFAFTTGQVVPHYDELMRRTVGEVMTAAVVHVEPSAPLTRVLQLMVSLKARSFPVLDCDRRLVGVISREDIMRGVEGLRAVSLKEGGLWRTLPAVGILGLATP